MLWIKFNLSRVKVCVVILYDLTQGDVEERKGSGMTWTELRIKRVVGID